MTRASAIATALCACCLLVLGASGWPLADALGPPPAGAASITATAGAAVGHTTVGSASWGSIPTATNTVAPSAGSSVTETFVLTLLNPPSQYFFAYNSGNVNLAGTTYSVVVTTMGLVIGSTPSAILTACLGAVWNSSTGVCSGTKGQFGTWTNSGSIATTDVPTTPGSYLSVQTSIGGLNSLGLGGSMTVTINTGVDPFASPRQIRSAITTNA